MIQDICCYLAVLYSRAWIEGDKRDNDQSQGRNLGVKIGGGVN